MSRKGAPASAGVRLPRQARSSLAQDQLVKATIAALSAKGMAGLTHREVARRAPMSLAATTYYYENKAAMVADASGKLLRSYIDAFRRAAAKYHAAPNEAPSFEEFFVHLLINGVGHHRDENIAWCEIMLDAANGGPSRQQAREWYGQLFEIWSDIARTVRGAYPQAQVRNALDTFAGLLFMVAALGIESEELAHVTAPDFAFGPSRDSAVEKLDKLPVRDGRKARETRERILGCAMDLMVRDGLSAVGYRQVAECSGLSIAAPAYYFGSIDRLLYATQLRLFRASKTRFRQVMRSAGQQAPAIENSVELTNVIFQREATEYARENAACLAVSLEASRNPTLRPLIRLAIADQAAGWRRALAGIGVGNPTINEIIPQALFLGKLLRILALGSQNSDLVHVREDFLIGLTAIQAGNFFAP